MAIKETLGGGSRLFERKKTNEDNSWVFRLFEAVLRSRKGSSQVAEVKVWSVASLLAIRSLGIC